MYLNYALYFLFLVISILYCLLVTCFVPVGEQYCTSWILQTLNDSVLQTLYVIKDQKWDICNPTYTSPFFEIILLFFVNCILDCLLVTCFVPVAECIADLCLLFQVWPRPKCQIVAAWGHEGGDGRGRDGVHGGVHGHQKCVQGPHSRTQDRRQDSDHGVLRARCHSVLCLAAELVLFVLHLTG